MPVHSDFQQIREGMRAQYGKRGDSIYYAWLNRNELDDSKPFPKDKKLKKPVGGRREKAFAEETVEKGYEFDPSTATFKIFSPIEIEKSADDESESFFTGIASTPSLDRQGEIISREALSKACSDLESKNTTVFLNHDYKGLGIGKVTKSWMDGNKLRIKVKPTKALAMQDAITQIKEGVLKSFSVGGKIKNAEEVFSKELGRNVKVITDLELLEVSVVGIPANPDASIEGVVSKMFEGGLMNFSKDDSPEPMPSVPKGGDPEGKPFEGMVWTKCPSCGHEGPIKMEETGYDAARGERSDKTQLHANYGDVNMEKSDGAVTTLGAPVKTGFGAGGKDPHPSPTQPTTTESLLESYHSKMEEMYGEMKRLVEMFEAYMQASGGKTPAQGHLSGMSEQGTDTSNPGYKSAVVPTRKGIVPKETEIKKEFDFRTELRKMYG